MSTWISAKLGELCTIVGGGTPTRSNPSFYGGHIPWVSPKDMKEWQISDSQIHITEAGLQNSATRLVPSGAVLIVVRSGVLKHTLPVAIGRCPVAINQDMKALLCGERLNPDFLARFLKERSRLILQWVRATTADNFPLDKLKELDVPLPPLSEQRRIADILDKADGLRAKHRAALAQLDTLAQSIFLDMFGDPATNPRGWPYAKLGDFIFSASDGPHVSPEYVESGIPFLSTRHVRRGAITWGDLKFISAEEAAVHWRKCKPECGDILYTKGGTTGLAATVTTTRPFAIWVHIALLKPNHEKVAPKWLETMLNTDFCYRQSQKLTHGIANHDLGLTRMVNIQMFSPPLDLQRQFVSRTAIVEKLRAAHSSSLDSLDALFSVLQHRAFRGELNAHAASKAA